MSGRIVAQPVGTAVATTDHFQRGSAQLARHPAGTADGDTAHDPGRDAPPDGHDVADVPPPLPRPPAPPGTMFAAAVMAGALPSHPVTHEEMLRRLGSAWTPPESDLRLTDIQA